jgi:hypothetical protein
LKLPKGFGKNYFSLNAITATVNQTTLNANATRVQTFHIHKFEESENETELEEDDLATACFIQNASKACHCNCHFLKKARKTLKLFFCQKLFFDYFQTLNNSISPPYDLFLTINKQI